MRLPINVISKEYIYQNNLLSLVIDEYVYIEISKKKVYGLPHAGRITYDQLHDHPVKYGYTPTRLTRSIWQHSNHSITFTLVVDDFGIKSIGQYHPNHLTNAIRNFYIINTHSTSSFYYSMTLEWNYVN